MLNCHLNAAVAITWAHHCDTPLTISIRITRRRVHFNVHSAWKSSLRSLTTNNWLRTSRDTIITWKSICSMTKASHAQNAVCVSFQRAPWKPIDCMIMCRKRIYNGNCANWSKMPHQFKSQRFVNAFFFNGFSKQNDIKPHLHWMWWKMFKIDDIFFLQVRTFAPREAIIPVINLNHVTMYMPNGMICLECGDDFQESNHIRSVSKCAKCKYQSACSRAILEHISNCNGDENVDSLIPSPLGCEMFCICGYSSSEGMFSVKIKLNFKFEKNWI